VSCVPRLERRPGGGHRRQGRRFEDRGAPVAPRVARLVPLGRRLELPRVVGRPRVRRGLGNGWGQGRRCGRGQGRGDRGRRLGGHAEQGGAERDRQLGRRVGHERQAGALGEQTREQRDARRSAREQGDADVGRGQPRGGDGGLHQVHRAGQRGLDGTLEGLAGELDLGARVREGNLHHRRRLGGQPLLGGTARCPQATKREHARRVVRADHRGDVADDPLHQRQHLGVEIDAAQIGQAGRLADQVEPRCRSGHQGHVDRRPADVDDRGGGADLELFVAGELGRRGDGLGHEARGDAGRPVDRVREQSLGRAVVAERVGDDEIVGVFAQRRRRPGDHCGEERGRERTRVAWLAVYDDGPGVVEATGQHAGDQRRLVDAATIGGLADQRGPVGTRQGDRRHRHGARDVAQRARLEARTTANRRATRSRAEVDPQAVTHRLSPTPTRHPACLDTKT
jgi:hypothetical protein